MHRETGLLAHGPESVPLEPPQFEADTRESHASVLDLMASYLEGGHPFPDRAHLSVLFATAQLAMFRSMDRWIEFAQHEVAEWPTTKDLGMTQRTEELIASWLPTNQPATISRRSQAPETRRGD